MRPWRSSQALFRKSSIRKQIDLKVYDFVDKKLGKAIPYGVYDVTKNKGFVSIEIDHDTAEFAVETIRRWWNNRPLANLKAYARGLILGSSHLLMQTGSIYSF